MCPSCKAKWHLVPDFPKFGRRHQINFAFDSSILPLLSHCLNRRLFPGGIRFAGNFYLKTIGIPRLSEEFFCSRDVTLHFRQLEIFGMNRANMMMFGDHPQTLMSNLEDWRVVGGEAKSLAHFGIVERL